MLFIILITCEGKVGLTVCIIYSKLYCYTKPLHRQCFSDGSYTKPDCYCLYRTFLKGYLALNSILAAGKCGTRKTGGAAQKF